MDKGPPPQYEQPAPQAQPQPTVVTHQTILAVGPQPMRITCPSCHALITTTVQLESSTKTHLMAVLLCLICLPCVVIPYCTDSCKSKNHYCPNCQAYIGSYSS